LALARLAGLSGARACLERLAEVAERGPAGLPSSRRGRSCATRGKSIGSFGAWKRIGTSTPRSAASRASPRTQRESTEFGVQATTSERARSSSREISESNSSPA
jgi:hypothetical protein